MQDYFTNYNFYSSGNNMELVTKIVDTLKKILEEDKKESQPLFLRISDNFILKKDELTLRKLFYNNDKEIALTLFQFVKDYDKTKPKNEMEQSLIEFFKDLYY